MADFQIEKIIYYHDTDSGGVVYYANYLKHLEEARTEYFRSKSQELKKWSEQGVLFVVTRVEIDYRSPAKYGDIIKISATVKNLKTAVIHFHQEITENARLLVEAEVTVVCVGKYFKPRRIPAEISEALLPG
ncbi:MAG: YbgC/FadM family acyl-CoA thioesterase [Candidatus Omnitrophica bacterium]|nr:YbgC/FadM family acyl-CoA thioesterase [Candidatus Omnitrophota bacterium]